MKKLQLFFSLLPLVFLSACDSHQKPIASNSQTDANENSELAKETTHEPKPKLFSTNELPKQRFEFDATKAKTLKGKKGIEIKVPANAFVNETGELVTTPIEIELIECNSLIDMVLGNLTTTTNGQFLESDGMFYIGAFSEGEQLKLADGKELAVEMKAHREKGMQLYEGVETDQGLDWQNPVQLNTEAASGDNGKVEGQIFAELEVEDGPSVLKSNAGYYVKGYNYTGTPPNVTFLKEFVPVPYEIVKAIGNLVWEEGGLMLDEDSVVYLFDTVEVWLVKVSEKRLGIVTPNTTQKQVKGTNQFAEDAQIRYVFNVKKLGWANIDRLFNDPRTKLVDLMVTVVEHDSFDNIYTSMIFKKQNMYLPGYQKKDNSFSFTHGDYEKTSLPVGETASILITAYKGDVPYYSLQTFKIQPSQQIDFVLSKTTPKDLKAILRSSI